MTTVNRPISAVLHDILGNVQDIVRSEVRLAKVELREEMTKSRSAAVQTRRWHAHADPLRPVHAFSRRTGANYRHAWMGGSVDSGNRRRRNRRMVPRARSQEVQGDSCGTENCCEHQGECRMGQTSDQIATHIDHTREDLKSNLEELETRVKAVTDWRGHLRKHPVPIVIAALVGSAARDEEDRKTHSQRSGS